MSPVEWYGFGAPAAVMAVCLAGTWWFMRRCDREDVQWQAIRTERLSIMAQHVIGDSERAARWMTEAQPCWAGAHPRRWPAATPRPRR